MNPSLFSRNSVSTKEVVIVALILGAFLLNATSLFSAPLKMATVQELKNNVEITKEGKEVRPATRNDVIQGKDLLKTGKKSRALLEFNDRSIARLGSNTTFSFDSAGREMKIDRGSALIHVPPGLSGARITTPAATAAILGDVVAMRVNREGATQIVALSRDSQGPITVTHHRSGDQRTLEPGELLTVNPMDIKLPDPVPISVDVFIQTSSFTSNQEDGFKTALPESAKQEIKQTEQIQQKEIATGGFETVALTIKPEFQLPVPLDNVAQINQVNALSKFVGSYIGKEKVPSSPITGYENTLLENFQFSISEDGKILGSTTPVFGGPSRIIQGFINQDGTIVSMDSNDLGSREIQATIVDGILTGIINKPPPNPPVTAPGYFHTVISGQRQ